MPKVVYFPARINTPSVAGELLKPVFSTSSASTKPAFWSIARKSFPGMAPPSQRDQLFPNSFFNFTSFFGLKFSFHLDTSVTIDWISAWIADEG
jgi:hypothetical protein